MESILHQPLEPPSQSTLSNSRPPKPLLSLQTDHPIATSSSSIHPKRSTPSHTEGLEFTASPAVGHPDQFPNFPSPFDPLGGRHSADNNNNNSSASTTQPGVRSSSKDLATVTSEAIFKQLDRIKTLQNEIARSHALLESTGRGEGDASNKSPKSPQFNSSSGFGFGEKGKEKEGVGGSKMRNGEKERTRAYEEMEIEFRERQKGVDEIMLKLSSLSTAVKTLHSLPSPSLFPSPSTSAHGNHHVKRNKIPGRGSVEMERADTAPHHEEGRPVGTGVGTSGARGVGVGGRPDVVRRGSYN